MLPFLKKILRGLKRFFIVVAVLLIVVNLFMYFINRDRPKLDDGMMKKSRAEIYRLINDQKLNSSKEGKILAATYRVLTCGAIGEGCTNNPDDGDKNFNSSFFGFISNLIVFPYINPPASGAYWVYSGLQNAGFFPKAYAAEGIGFAAIKPLMGIWKIFRDISYMILVLILIIIGFMIMFRMKINPQTVISIENALPRIVISLILITFSFAIAGFLIDLMYLVMAISISILAGNPSKPFYNVGQFQNKYLSGGPQAIVDDLFPFSPLEKGLSSFGPAGEILKMLVPVLSPVSKFIGLMSVGMNIFLLLPQMIQGFVGLISTLAVAFFSLRIAANIKGTGIIDAFNELVVGALGFNISSGNIVSSIISVGVFVLAAAVLAFILLPFVLALLIFLTILFLFFRIFFMLLTAYLKILLLILFSPLFALVEAIPGKNAFSYWFKNLLAEIMTFPIVAILLIVGYIITNNVSTGAAWSYGFLGTKQPWAPPFLYGFNEYAYSFLIGMGLLFLIPDLVKLAKGFIGVKEGFPISVGPGLFFGGASAAVGGGVGIISQFGSLSLGLTHLGVDVKGIFGGIKQGAGSLFSMGKKPEGTGK